MPPLSFHTSYRDLAGIPRVRERSTKSEGPGSPTWGLAIPNKQTNKPRDQLRRPCCHNTRYQSNADTPLGQSWRHSSTITFNDLCWLLASIKTTQAQFKTLDCGCCRHSASFMFGQCCRWWASISWNILLSPAGRLTMTALSPLLNHSRHGR